MYRSDSLLATMNAATTPRRTNCCSLAAAEDTNFCCELFISKPSRASRTCRRTLSWPEM